jgi:CRP-like cAMP-binding protein
MPAAWAQAAPAESGAGAAKKPPGHPTGAADGAPGARLEADLALLHRALRLAPHARPADLPLLTGLPASRLRAARQHFVGLGDKPQRAHTAASSTPNAAALGGDALRLYHAVAAQPGLHAAALAQAAGLTRAEASRHAAALARAGLLRRIAVGRQAHYVLA